MQGKDIVNYAMKFLGVCETPDGSNRTIFNKWFYGSDVVAQWCCIFVMYVFNGVGCLDLLHVKTDACRVYEKNALKHNEAVSVNAAMPGDVVTFNFDANDQATVEAHHIGIVVENLGNGKLKTIEGNTGNSVQIRERKNGIRYVFRPAYDKIENIDDNLLKSQMISKGSKNNCVKVLQLILNIEADGIFGSQTELAVLQFQRMHDLEVDGIVGPLTWRSLMEVFTK